MLASEQAQAPAGGEELILALSKGCAVAGVDLAADEGVKVVYNDNAGPVHTMQADIVNFLAAIGIEQIMSGSEAIGRQAGGDDLAI